jgi:hypothetical protein
VVASFDIARDTAGFVGVARIDAGQCASGTWIGIT